MGMRLKILSGFLFLAMVLFLAGIYSIYELTTVGTTIQAILDDNYKSINAARMMTDALEREDSAVLLLLSGNWNKGREIIQAADPVFLENFRIAANNVTIPGEKNFVDAIEKSYTNYKKLWMRPIVGTSRERNLDWYFQEVHGAFLKVKTDVENLMALNDQTMYKTASQLKNKAHRAVMPGVVAMLSALIFSLIFSYFINYYVVSPILRITKGIRNLLQAGQPFHVQVESNDELQDLVSSVHALAAKIGEKE